MSLWAWLIPLVLVWAFVIGTALSVRRRRVREGEPPVSLERRGRPRWTMSQEQRDRWRE